VFVTAPKVKESKVNRSKVKREGRFTPPSLEEVSDYIKKQGYSIDPQHFIDKQEERGWELKNGKKIKDWKATVRTWERNEKKMEKRGIRGHL
jgi:hypothetical protein